MTDAVEMTTNQFHLNSSIKLAYNLSTLLTGNVMKFPGDLTTIFNTVSRSTTNLIGDPEPSQVYELPKALVQSTGLVTRPLTCQRQYRSDCYSLLPL